MQALPPPGGFIPRTHHTKGGHTQTHPDRHTHFILSSTRCTLLHTLTRTLYIHTHTQMHTLLVVNETHSPAPIPSTLRHHVHISLTHHSHVTHILSPRQHPEWNPRPEERSRQRSKCKTQSLRSVGPEAVPDQWFGLNSSGYFPNNSSLCPNSPSSVACPATWSLILLLAFLFLHAGCVPERGNRLHGKPGRGSVHLSEAPATGTPRCVGVQCVSGASAAPDPHAWGYYPR